MKLLRKLLVKLHLAHLQPHEKAELGQGLWGRATAKGKVSIKARVYRASTDTWEDV